MLLIGSGALRKHGIDPQRLQLDEDYICTIDEYHAFVKNKGKDVVHAVPMNDSKFVVKTINKEIFEFEIAWGESEPTSSDLILEANKGKTIASLETLLLLKLSHRYKKDSPHFYKTLCDIELLRNHGVILPKEMKKILKLREKETYTYKHPNLNQGKENFFKNDGLKYIYDHDTIHLAVKHFEKPAYEYYKSDNAQVLCDKEKFWALPEEYRLRGVLEEVLVLALERSQIPNKYKVDRRWSFNKAHEKVCTSITSGFFREFAYDNFRQVQAMYLPTYVDTFIKGIESGIVKPHRETNETANT